MLLTNMFGKICIFLILSSVPFHHALTPDSISRRDALKSSAVSLAGLVTPRPGSAAETVDMVVLSSDDQEIIDVAVKYGCDVPFERPADIATDEAPMIEVLHPLAQSVPDQAAVVALLNLELDS